MVAALRKRNACNRLGWRGRRRACASLVASSAAGVAVWNVGWALQLTRLELERIAASHRRAHRHPVALRPRVAARSPMSGASWRATKAAECISSYVGRQVIDARARSWARRPPRALRCGTGANPSRFPPLNPVCEAVARTSCRPAHYQLPYYAPARCGAFADERRVVPGDGGGLARLEPN